MRIYKKLGKFGFGLGWFGGEEFALLEIDVLRQWELGGMTILSIKITKFLISLSWY